jgi:hypothetical protein
MKMPIGRKGLLLLVMIVLRGCIAPSPLGGAGTVCRRNPRRLTICDS